MIWTSALLILEVPSMRMYKRETKLISNGRVYQGHTSEDVKNGRKTTLESQEWRAWEHNVVELGEGKVIPSLNTPNGEVTPPNKDKADRFLHDDRPSKCNTYSDKCNNYVKYLQPLRKY